MQAKPCFLVVAKYMEAVHHCQGKIVTSIVGVIGFLGGEPVFMTGESPPRAARTDLFTERNINPRCEGERRSRAIRRCFPRGWTITAAEGATAFRRSPFARARRRGLAIAHASSGGRSCAKRERVLRAACRRGFCFEVMPEACEDGPWRKHRDRCASAGCGLGDVV
jgi:hypothetical protein